LRFRCSAFSVTAINLSTLIVRKACYKNDDEGVRANRRRYARDQMLLQRHGFKRGIDRKVGSSQFANVPNHAN